MVMTLHLPKKSEAKDQLSPRQLARPSNTYGDRSMAARVRRITINSGDALADTIEAKNSVCTFSRVMCGQRRNLKALNGKIFNYDTQLGAQYERQILFSQS
jgi:sulfatase maturation enzyme AslB (radical SAM superfamily)